MIGIDILKVSRFRNSFSEKFRERVFSDREQAYCEAKHNKILHYAARFAAKEAIYKAIGDNKNLGWKDIKILNDTNGKPYCILNDRKFVNKILISISHTRNYAVASAVVTK